MSIHEKYTPKKEVIKEQKISVKRLKTYTPRYLEMTESIQRKSVISSPIVIQHVASQPELTPNVEKVKKTKLKKKKQKRLKEYLNKYETKNTSKSRSSSIRRSKSRKVAFKDPEDSLINADISFQMGKTQMLPLGHENAFNIVEDFNLNSTTNLPINTRSNKSKSRTNKSVKSKSPANTNKTASKPHKNQSDSRSPARSKSSDINLDTIESPSKSSATFSDKSMQKYLKGVVEDSKRGFNHTVTSSINSEYFIDPPNVFKNSATRYTDQVSVETQQLQENSRKLQLDIDQQKLIYEKKLEEQMEKYYKQLKEKDSIIGKLNEKIFKLESEEDKDDNLQRYSTHDISKFSSKTPPASKRLKDSRGSSKTFQKGFEPEELITSQSNYFDFIEAISHIKGNTGKISLEVVDNAQSSSYEISTLKSHLLGSSRKTSLLNKNMKNTSSARTLRNTSDKISTTPGNVWEIPDSCKVHSKKDLQTGFYFDCEA